MIRVSKYSIPNEQSRCPRTTCAYNSHSRGCFDGGTCDEPRINKGNSDADCHSMSNKDLLALLKEAKEFWDKKLRQVAR